MMSFTSATPLLLGPLLNISPTLKIWPNPVHNKSLLFSSAWKRNKKLKIKQSCIYKNTHDNFRFPGNFWLQLNLSTMATKESGCCREVRFFIAWTPHSQVLVDTISRYSVNIIISQISVNMSGEYQLVCQSTSVGRVSVNMLADILANSWLGVGRHVSQEVCKLERWDFSSLGHPIAKYWLTLSAVTLST